MPPRKYYQAIPEAAPQPPRVKQSAEELYQALLHPTCLVTVTAQSRKKLLKGQYPNKNLIKKAVGCYHKIEHDHGHNHYNERRRSISTSSLHPSRYHEEGLLHKKRMSSSPSRKYGPVRRVSSSKTIQGPTSYSAMTSRRKQDHGTIQHPPYMHNDSSRYVRGRVVHDNGQVMHYPYYNRKDGDNKHRLLSHSRI